MLSFSLLGLELDQTRVVIDSEQGPQCCLTHLSEKAIYKVGQALEALGLCPTPVFVIRLL